MNLEELIDEGYKKFNNDGYFNSSDYGYQKKFCDEKGVMYFITIWVYDYNKPRYEGNSIHGRIGFTPDIQFQINDDVTVNIEYILNDDTSLQSIEDKVHNLWLYHDKPYYELYC